MTRPQSRYPLAVFDPVWGDPERVRTAGEDYLQLAATIAQSADDLRTIAAEMDGSSAAVDEVDVKATRLADTIERAHGRYAAAGRALVTYSQPLARAQELSLAALDRAVAALRAQDEAMSGVVRWTRFATDDPVSRARYLALADDARAEVLRTDDELEAARKDLRAAESLRDAAAATACAAILDAIGRDDLHDTIWQDLGGGAQEVGLFLRNGVDEVDEVLSVAAVALCWLPGVNAVAAAASTVAGVLVLVRDSVNLATGNGSWDEVRTSAIGVLTFGLGRFAERGARLSVAVARRARGLRAGNATDGARGVVESSSAAGRVAERGVIARSDRFAAVGSALRSRELWAAMTPGAIARDTWTDLRSGVDLARAPALYRPTAAGHVARPVDTVANPLREYTTEVSKTWAESRAAGVLVAVGNEAAAQAMAPSRHITPRYGWAALSGGVQVVETVCGAVATPGMHITSVEAACAGTTRSGDD